jgi:hypothetical protein
LADRFVGRVAAEFTRGLDGEEERRLADQAEGGGEAMLERSAGEHREPLGEVGLIQADEPVEVLRLFHALEEKAQERAGAVVTGRKPPEPGPSPALILVSVDEAQEFRQAKAADQSREGLDELLDG